MSSLKKQCNAVIHLVTLWCSNNESRMGGMAWAAIQDEATLAGNEMVKHLGDRTNNSY